MSVLRIKCARLVSSSIRLSADAFRKAVSSKDQNGKFSSTPNVFFFDPSGFDANNFNFLKEYGAIYFWDSLEDYQDYKG